VTVAPRPDDDIAALALAVVDHIDAMVAYWDKSQTCRFANEAYLAWFGWKRDSLLGHSMRELLGPEIYAMNLPHIEAALRGERQVFERSIPVPGGTGRRDSIATYTPDIAGTEVRGFFVHVADATLLKTRERELARALDERDRALGQVRTLTGLLPVCASCKNIRDEAGQWTRVEHYIAAHSDASFTHSLCPECSRRLYPDLQEPTP
jgi:PAS domain S-box-containing protein